MADEATESKSTFDYKAWYEANKAEVAERRNKKYADDAEYREKRKEEAVRYYWLHQRRASKLEAPLPYERLELVPDSSVRVEVENAQDVRHGMEFEVPVFLPRTVAGVLGRSTQTMRLWFLHGYLADVFMRNARNARLYTEDQVRVFVEHRHWLGFSVQDFSKHPFFTLVNERCAQMPDAIEPMSRDEWRLVPDACPFCGAEPALQRLVDGEWRDVNCFKCLHPLNWRDRQRMRVFLVEGACGACGYLNEVEAEAVDASKVRVMCEKCGRPLSGFTTTEVSS